MDFVLRKADEGDEAVEFAPEDVVLEVCKVDSGLCEAGELVRGAPEGTREEVFSRS